MATVTKSPQVDHDHMLGSIKRLSTLTSQMQSMSGQKAHVFRQVPAAGIDAAAFKGMWKTLASRSKLPEDEVLIAYYYQVKAAIDDIMELEGLNPTQAMNKFVAEHRAKKAEREKGKY